MIKGVVQAQLLPSTQQKKNKLDGFSGYKLTFDVEVEDFTLRFTLPIPADAAIPSCTVTSNTLQNETLICYDYACRYVVTKFLVLEPNNNKKRFEYPDDGDNRRASISLRLLSFDVYTTHIVMPFEASDGGQG